MPFTALRALLQGSSRYSTRMASAGSIEQTFVRLEDGIQRLTLPLPTGPNHVGGAANAAMVTGAPVFQGGLDYAQCERVWGSRDWPERMAAWFTRHGVPAPVADDLIEQGHAFAPFIRYALDPELLYE